MTTLNRTYHPKFAQYWGDGNGRDHYITFNNGGLNAQRMYGKDTRVQWKETRVVGGSMKGPSSAASPKKEATALRYWGDGSGRDHHIIFDQGQMREHKSNFQGFQKQLRSSQATPNWDRRQIVANSPRRADLSLYNNWYSPSNRQNFQNMAKEQRRSIERLSQSPKRGMTAPAPTDYSDGKMRSSFQKTIPTMGNPVFTKPAPPDQKVSYKIAMKEFLDQGADMKSKAHQSLDASPFKNDSRVNGSAQKLSAQPFFPRTSLQRNMTPAVSGKRMPLAPVEILDDKAATKLRQSTIVAVSDAKNKPELLHHMENARKLSAFDNAVPRFSKTSHGLRPHTIMASPQTVPKVNASQELGGDFNQIQAAIQTAHGSTMALPIKTKNSEKINRFKSGSTAPSSMMDSPANVGMNQQRVLATADQKHRSMKHSGNVFVRSKLVSQTSSIAGKELEEIKIDSKIEDAMMKTHQEKGKQKLRSAHGSEKGF